VTATPAIPFVKTFDFAYGAPTPLSERVTRVIARNPGPFTYTGSGTYIVAAGGEAAVIDPGPDLDAHLDALVAALSGRPVSHILVTHTHGDHCGLARRFADRVGAPIFAFGPHPVRSPRDDAPALDEGGDYAFAPDETLADGAVIAGEGWSIEAVHTPGHLSNHLCFALREEEALFTGDHIMGWSTSVVAPPDGSMGDYLASLEKLLTRTDRLYYPTHGAPIDRPQAFVRAVRAHRRIRDGQILDQLSKGKSKIREIVAALYADIDPRLHGAAALNVFAHLIRLVETGAVACEGAPSPSAAYRSAARDGV
jgi:glyoxylase-like metal-dependent hydrolase (beta-lactamase superfamily II)